MSAIDFLLVLLQVVFIVLKLLHIIDWAWVLVLSPIWIAVAITVIYLVVFFVIIWRTKDEVD